MNDSSYTEDEFVDLYCRNRHAIIHGVRARLNCIDVTATRLNEISARAH